MSNSRGLRSALITAFGALAAAGLVAACGDNGNGTTDPERVNDTEQTVTETTPPEMTETTPPEMTEPAPPADGQAPPADDPGTVEIPAPDINLPEVTTSPVG
ncbi:hypothetical protein [Mycobacterium sp. SMC-4]|uniref:hypothetical protein n=1 Tax=Mycobacterium sp. SMC-4 TaxID=2857059 RepID=UPI0021B3402D|nr:hypothetical protein [Mycobacterium sp. SMC-4]UXA19727.1 hypothetical protein KXD98_09095 [Mycobacterium sp. SMC-4]